MKRFPSILIIFLIQMLSTCIWGDVIIRSHTQSVPGTIILHVYSNTAYGENSQAQGRYGDPYSYTGFVAGTYLERGSGENFTNWDITISGLPENGSADFEACKEKDGARWEYTGFIYTVSGLMPVELSLFYSYYQ